MNKAGHSDFEAHGTRRLKMFDAQIVDNWCNINQMHASDQFDSTKINLQNQYYVAIWQHQNSKKRIGLVQILYENKLHFSVKILILISSAIFSSSFLYKEAEQISCQFLKRHLIFPVSQE